MKYSETTLTGDVEILASNDYQAIPAKITTASGATSTIVKAGTPIDTTGAPATSNVVGLLLYDVDVAKNPNAALLVDGIVDATKAQAHCAVTYTSDVTSALPNIIFRTNCGVNS